jgi:hypothetical protein
MINETNSNKINPLFEIGLVGIKKIIIKLNNPKSESKQMIITKRQLGLVKGERNFEREREREKRRIQKQDTKNEKKKNESAGDTKYLIKKKNIYQKKCLSKG